MGNVYRNLNKTREFYVDKLGGRYIVAEHDVFGNRVGKLVGSYDTADEAEMVLEDFADDNGFRWAGKND